MKDRQERLRCEVNTVRQFLTHLMNVAEEREMTVLVADCVFIEYEMDINGEDTEEINSLRYKAVFEMSCVQQKYDSAG